MLGMLLIVILTKLVLLTFFRVTYIFIFILVTINDFIIFTHSDHVIILKILNKNHLSHEYIYNISIQIPYHPFYK